MSHDPDNIHLPAMPLPPELPLDDGCTGEGRGRGHTYTASEVKVLTETAGEAAYALGRKDAGEEIAARIRTEINAFPSYAWNAADVHNGLKLALVIANDTASQPPSATSDATSGVPGHPEVSEAVRSPQEPGEGS